MTDPISADLIAEQITPILNHSIFLHIQGFYLSILHYE